MEDLINIISEIATPYLNELNNEFKEYFETLNNRLAIFRNSSIDFFCELKGYVS